MRHDTLIPLTHDHHHALKHARHLRMAANHAAEERVRSARDFIAFFEGETVDHFREEEELIFPLVVDRSEAEAALSRLLMEHIRIHALVAQLRKELDREPQSATMTSLASTLEAHIRFEEKEFFPLVEKVVADEDLAGISLRPRDRTGA